MTTQRTLPDELNCHLETLADAKAFIRVLHREGLHYHFEDSAYDCLSDTGLSHDDMGAIQLGVEQLYTFDWGPRECPIGYLLHVMAEHDSADQSCLVAAWKSDRAEFGWVYGDVPRDAPQG